METHKSEILQVEAKDQGLRYRIIGEIGARMLRDTALTGDGPWQRSDVEAARDFFVAAAPYAGNRVYPNFWEHSLLTSIVDRKIAEKIAIPELDPDKSEVEGLLHDKGRLVVPNRYGRTDRIDEALARKAGVTPPVISDSPPLERILRMHHPVLEVDDLTLAQIVNHVADNLGKKNRNGELVRPEEILEYNSTAAYTDPVWPSEAAALRYLKGIERATNQLVYDEILYLRSTYGVDFEQLREEVAREFESPENQKWLQEVKNAQETLDPSVDEKLQRPPIKHVVIDIGGVLLQTSENESVKVMAEKLGVEEEKMANVLGSIFYSPQAMEGRTSDGVLFDQMYQELGIPPLSLEESQRVFQNPAIYQPVPGMQKIVERLCQKGDVSITLYTDSIGPVAGVVREAVHRLYPDLAEAPLLVSAETQTSKVGGSAYPFLLDQLGNPKSGSVLFVDDQETFTTKARAGHGMRGFTFRGNPYQELSAAGRLQAELESAHLI